MRNLDTPENYSQNDKNFQNNSIGNEEQQKAATNTEHLYRKCRT